MRSPEEIIQSILTHQYDPEQAHLYYLRTRELKGRTPGQSPEPTDPRSRGTVKPAPGKRLPSKVIPSKKQVDAKTAEQRRKETEAKIQALQGRLETLRKVLAQLVEQAKARSGVDTKTPPKADDKKTTAEKKAASEASKKYYEKHKNDPTQQTPDEQVKQLESKVKAIQAKIQEMRDKLKAPVKQQTTRKTGSVGVVPIKR